MWNKRELFLLLFRCTIEGDNKGNDPFCSSMRHEKRFKGQNNGNEIVGVLQRDSDRKWERTPVETGLKTTFVVTKTATKWTNTHSPLQMRKPERGGGGDRNAHKVNSFRSLANSGLVLVRLGRVEGLTQSLFDVYYRLRPLVTHLSSDKLVFWRKKKKPRQDSLYGSPEISE